MRHPSLTSLRARLLVVLLGLTALPALLIGGLAYRNARQTVERRVEAQLTSIADLKQEQITTWLDSRAGDARLLTDNFLNQEHFTEILDPATDPERRAAFAAFLTDNLIGVQKARSGYAEILFVDAAGRVILSTDPSRVGADLAASPAVYRTLASPAGERVEDIQRGPDGEIEMAFGHVLHAVDLGSGVVLPAVNGAAVIRVRMDETIYPLIRAWPGMGATGETLLVRSDGDSTLFLNPLRFDENAALAFAVAADSPDARPAHLAAAGQAGIIQTTDYRGVPVLAAYRSIPQTGWGFVAKEDLAEAFAPVNDLTRQWLWVTGLVFLAAIIAAVLLARALTEPLARLVRVSQTVAAGRFENDLPLQRADEIGQLAAAFKAMMAAVRAREAELKAHGEEVRALFSLSQTLLGMTELEAILSAALRQALAGTKTAAGAILLADAGGETLTLRAAIGLPPEVVGRRFPIDARTAPGYALSLRRPTASADLEDETAFDVPSFVRELGVRANLAVPMLIGERAVGALVVDSFEPRVFAPDEIRVAQAIANQTAMALERARLFDDLRESYDQTLDALAAALDARDKETEGHSRRVVAYTLALARRMNVPGAGADGLLSPLDTIRRGALLHDIGKIGVPDAILLKPGPLTDDEWATMRRHPEWGQRILSGIGFLQGAVDIVCAHQERWDGQGYPKGLKGEAIPLGARIFAVADTFDAITSDRPYRPGRPYAVARAEIEAGSGTQFDPRAVEAFLQIPDAEWARLREEVATAMAKAMTFAPEAPPTAHPALPPELGALTRLLAAVNGTLDLEEVLREAARATVDALGAAASALFLYERDTDTLRLAGECGLPEALRDRFARFSVEGFHNEAVVREARLSVIADPASVPAFVELGLPVARPDLGAYLCVPLTAGAEVHGILGVFGRRPRGFGEAEQRLYCAIGEQVGRAIANAHRHEAVQRLAVTDGLTGAHNRRYLDGFLAGEVKRGVRSRHGLSVIMLDVDGFKGYNDAHGHAAGDEALRQLARVLRENLRALDVVARYGGEEFAVAMPETGLAGALAAAEKLRRAVEAHPFPEGSLTISLGVATGLAGGDVSPEGLLAAADAALYEAKRLGKNSVRSASPRLGSRKVEGEIDPLRPSASIPRSDLVEGGEVG